MTTDTPSPSTLSTTTTIPPPANPPSTTSTCITLNASTVTSMTEVRAGIDALDVQIVTLLGTRMRFIEAASRIKPTRESVRDEKRKADVIAKAKDTARRVGFPEDICESVYEALVEGCIEREGVLFERLHRSEGREGEANGSA